MKVSILSMLALLIAIAASAFNSPQKSKKNSTIYHRWFVFFGNNNTAGDVSDPDKYYLDSGTGEEATACYGGGDYMCEIYIQPQAWDPTKPDLSQYPWATMYRPYP